MLMEEKTSQPAAAHVPQEGPEVAPSVTGENRPNAEFWVPFTHDSLHDFAGPLNQLCTLTSLLSRRCRGQLDDEAETILKLVAGSSQRLQNLLAGLETYARIVGSPGPFRRCDANALLAGALGSLRRLIEENNAVITHDTLPQVPCDSGQITFALASLIENAIKFRTHARPEVHVSAIAQTNRTIFSIRDNGIGIAPKHHDGIFRMFKRVHNDSYSGAGVGLTIVERIVERHGGLVWVESELDRGATFFFSVCPDGHPEAAAVL